MNHLPDPASAIMLIVTISLLTSFTSLVGIYLAGMYSLRSIIIAVVGKLKTCISRSSEWVACPCRRRLHLNFQTSCLWPSSRHTLDMFAIFCLFIFLQWIIFLILHLPTADRCHTCLAENFQIDHPDDSENFGGGQYYHMDGIGKDLDCPIMSDVDYRCFDPVRDIGFVECLNQDFVNYISSSPWYRRYKKHTDLAISDYCSGIIWSVMVFFCCTSTSRLSIDDAITAEACALLNGLILAGQSWMQQNYGQVWLHGDRQGNAASGGFYWSGCSNLTSALSDVVIMIKLISHLPREADRAADVLAGHVECGSTCFFCSL